jgi:hypothetical protein
VFCADEHLVLYAHSEAVKVFGELEIGRDVDAFETRQRMDVASAPPTRAQADSKIQRTGLDGDDHPFLQPKTTTKMEMKKKQKFS